MVYIIGSRVGKPVHNIDKEFHRKFDGVVVEEIRVTENDDKTGKPRFTKALEVIEWGKPLTREKQQEFRFTYWDRTKFERRPLILSRAMFEDILNQAVDKNIISIDRNKLRVNFARRKNKRT